VITRVASSAFADGLGVPCPQSGRAESPIVRDSHSLAVAQETMLAVQRYLEVQSKGALPEVQTFPQGWGIDLAHALNRVLRLMNIHFSRAAVHDDAMREAHRGYDPIVKSTALGTILQLEADPTGFDAVYAALSDEESRRTFDWFISFRTALAFLGGDAVNVVPGRMSMVEWQKTLDQAARTCAGKAYHVGEVTVASGLPEVAATFFLEQYRLEGIVEPQDGDVVLDCGAYRGETALWFARQVGKGGRVIAFEPAARNAEGLRANLAANRSVEMAPVTVLQSAVSNSVGMLRFNAVAEGSSRADDESTESIPTVTIDDVVEQQHLGRVDLIKMDIEGGEVDALRGAKGTLRAFAPRLAISVYHRPNDLPDIVAVVRQALPDCQLYLSHKSPGLAETVLFVRCD
jgi:FkbM family methyltransferase